MLPPASEHSLLEIQAALRKFGLIAEAQRLKLSDALQGGALAVCHFPNQEHFVIAAQDGKGATMFYDDDRIRRLGTEAAEQVIGDILLAVSKPKQPLQMIFPERAKKAGDAPLIQLDSLHKDLGSITGNGDGTYHATFQLSNLGKQPLTIQNAQTDCSCLTTDVSKDVVLPGQTQTIRLTFQSETQEYQKEFLHDATITSDDPAMPVVTVGVSGVIKNTILNLPRVVNFGEVWWGNSSSRDFYIQFASGHPVNDLGRFTVSTSAPDVKCQLGDAGNDQP